MRTGQGKWNDTAGWNILDGDGGAERRGDDA